MVDAPLDRGDSLRRPQCSCIKAYSVVVFGYTNITRNVPYRRVSDGISQTSHRPHKQYMTETDHDDQSVYEVGYLISSSIPEEKVPEASEAVKKLITDAGSSIIADEAPHRQQLAYTIRKKTVSGAYDKHDIAYFGWIKFELGSDKIEAVKKEIELLPAVLRSMIISTVRENTYLGKRAPAVIATPAFAAATGIGADDEKKEVVAPASIEEMDKSIENMVKEA